MKKLKSVGQYFVALALALVISVSSISPAHAVAVEAIVVEALVGSAVNILLEQVVKYFDNASTAAERQDALSVIHDYFVRDSENPFDDTSGCIRMGADELADIAAELTMSGFPCEVVSYGYTNAGGVYSYVWVIQCVGWVYIPGVITPEESSGNGFGGGDPAFSVSGRYFTIGGQWLYAEGSFSSNVLNSLYKKFIDYTKVWAEEYIYINTALHAIVGQLEHLTGYIVGFEDDPTVPSLFSKIDDLITAVENLSVVGGGDVNLDTSPITNKLDDVITALDNSSIITKLDEVIVAVNNSSDDDVTLVVAPITNLLQSAIVAINDIDFNVSPVVNAISSLEITVAGSAADQLQKLNDLKTTIKQSIVDTAQNRDALLGTIISKMDSMVGFELDIDTLEFDTVAFDTRPIVNAIESLHSDFDDYFAQFGQSIDYGEVLLSLSGNQELYWDSDSQAYLSGTLTEGSSVTIYRMPDVGDGRGGDSSSYPYIVDNDGCPAVLPAIGDRFPNMLSFKYDSVVNTVTFSHPDGFSGYVSGNSAVITDGVRGEQFLPTFYGRSTQSVKPTASAPVSVLGYGADESGALTAITAIVSNGGTRSDTIVSAVPAGGLHGLKTSSSSANFVDESGQKWICDTVQGNVVTKYIKSITLNGSENWEVYGNGDYSYYGFKLGSFGSVVTGAAMSTHFPYAYVTTSNKNVGVYVTNSSSADQARLSIRHNIDGVSTLSGFKNWLKANPVTVYYATTKPTTREIAFDEDSGFSDFMLYGTTYEPNTYIESDCFFDVVYQALDPISSLYADDSGNWYFGYRSGDSKQILNSATLAVLRDAFNVRTYTDVDSVVFNDGKNHVEVSDGGQLNMTIMQGNKIIMWYVNWLHESRSWLDGRFLMLESALSNLDIDGPDIDIDNSTDININQDNDSYNVFYVTDPETGEDTSIVDLSGDALTAFGRLLNFLYQIGFGDALENFGGTVDGLTDFYMDVGNGGVDVWAS